MTLPGSGMETCNATFAPSPSYSVEQPVALSLTQNGLAAGLKAIPQAFCNTPSTFGAAPARLDTSGVTT